MPKTDEGADFRFSVGQRSDAVHTEFLGGVVRFTLDDGHIIEIEAKRRPGNPPGLMVRGLDCSLDLQLEVGNVVIVKPRRAIRHR